MENYEIEEWYQPDHCTRPKNKTKKTPKKLRQGSWRDSILECLCFCCFSARAFLLLFYIFPCIWVKPSSKKAMFPLHGARKRVNHSLSFAAGPKYLLTSKNGIHTFPRTLAVSKLLLMPALVPLYLQWSIKWQWHLIFTCHSPLIRPYPGFLKEYVILDPFSNINP